MAQTRTAQQMGNPPAGRNPGGYGGPGAPSSSFKAPRAGGAVRPMPYSPRGASGSKG